MKSMPSCESICDALLGGAGRLGYETSPDFADALYAVSEASVEDAVRFMVTQEKYVLEGASCTTVAAVRDFPDIVGGENIALIISGSNFDGDVLTRLLCG